MSLILKEGWLEKKGSFFATWKKRWVVLTKTSLDYYTDETKSDKKGFIPLCNESSVQKLEDTSSQRVKFVVISKQRSLEVTCPQVDYDGWVETLEQIFNSNNDDPVMMEVVPENPATLLEYSISDLRKICVKMQIDCQKFSTTKQFIEAITALYPKDSFSKLRYRISEIEHESFLATALSDGLVAEVNDMFGQLLAKLGVDTDLFLSLAATITVSQKILYLRSSIW